MRILVLRLQPDPIDCKKSDLFACVTFIPLIKTTKIRLAFPAWNYHEVQGGIDRLFPREVLGKICIASKFFAHLLDCEIRFEFGASPSITRSTPDQHRRGDGQKQCAALGKEVEVAAESLRLGFAAFFSLTVIALAFFICAAIQSTYSVRSAVRNQRTRV